MKKNNLKILLFDIETTPNLGYVWGKWEQNVISFKDHWSLLCFAWKWLGDTNTKIESLRQYDDEKGMVKRLHELFNEADVIIAHNGDQFDIKKSNALFVKFGLTPPSKYTTIDTKKVAKKYFRFDSNKLDDLGDYLGLGRKINTGGFELWLGCMAGKRKEWLLMEKYNKQDVDLLEKIYLKLRPWMGEAHPHHGINCPVCGNTHLQKRGYSLVKGNFRRQRFQCKCGSWTTGDKEKTS